MATNKIKLDIKPEAYNVYEMLNHLTNTESFALGEFVDNASASFFENEDSLKGEKLIVDIFYDQNAGTLRIKDNAFGMDLEDFKRAILVGAKTNKANSRNEFGKGLKTGACWYGRRWSVESTQLKKKTLYSACIDIDELVQNKSNSTDITESDIDKNEHYTIITIEKLSHPLDSAKVKKQVIADLGSMYRRDILSGNVEIYFNNKLIEYEEPPILFFKGKPMKKSVTIQIQYKNKIYKSKGYVALSSNQKKQSISPLGLTFFRRDRGVLINLKPKEIVGAENSVIAWKLFGELDVDDFEVNQAKDGLAWPNELKEKFYEKLKEQIPEIIAVGKLTWEQIAEKEGQPLQEKPTKIKNTPVTAPEPTSIIYPTQPTKSQEPLQVNSPTPSFTTTVQENFSFILDKIEYSVTYELIKDTFLYKYDKENCALKINKNHKFINNLSSDLYEPIGKIILSYVLAEEEAINQSGGSGNINPAMIHISFSKLLSNL